MIATTLGRTQQELSWLREELIEEGDVYAPKRGQLAMAVPLFNQYVLSHYERTRPEAGTPLLSLDQMIANARLVAPWALNTHRDPLSTSRGPARVTPTEWPSRQGSRRIWSGGSDARRGRESPDTPLGEQSERFGPLFGV